MFLACAYGVYFKTYEKDSTPTNKKRDTIAVRKLTSVSLKPFVKSKEDLNLNLNLNKTAETSEHLSGLKDI